MSDVAPNGAPATMHTARPYVWRLRQRHLVV